MPRGTRRAAWAVALLCWALLLAPLFVGAAYALPATDDFVFSSVTRGTWVQTHSLPHVLKDALSYALRTWHDWQGTVSGVVMMTLCPAVFCLRAYPLHAAALLLVWLGSLFLVVRALCRRLGLGPGPARAAFLGLSLVQLLFWPGYVEGFYWYNGAWFYTFTQALSGLTLLLFARMAGGTGTAGDDTAGTGRLRAAGRGALLCALMAFIGLNNYITALYTLAAAALLLVHAALRDRRSPPGRRSLHSLRGLIPCALALLVGAACLLASVLAPGNAVRLETDGWFRQEDLWLLRSVWRTLLAALGYVWRFLTRTPLLALLLGLTPAAYAALRRSGASFGAPWLAPPLALLLLCAMIFPHMYTSGYAGPARVVNLYHAYCTVALPFVWAYLLGAAARRRGGRPLPRRLTPALAAAGLLALCLSAPGFQGAYAQALDALASGRAQAARDRAWAQYALLEQAGPGDDVVVPPDAPAAPFSMGTLSEDPADWKNVGMADYFGVRSVRPENPQSP